MMNEVRPYPLMADAIRRGALDELKDLFRRFPDFVALEVPGSGNWLIYGCRHGTAAVVEFLLDAGFDLNKLNRRGDMGALDAAATAGNIQSVDLLVSRGATLRTDSASLNPLFGAILGRSPAVARKLLAAGIDTNKRYTLGAQTNPSVDAVAFAMLHGQREIAHLIALANAGDDEEIAQAAMAEGLRIAEQVTEK